MVLVAHKGRQGRLSLVKRARAVSPRMGVASQSKLNDQERKLLSQYCQSARLDGICVGALVGEDLWDIRPMVVQGGFLTITRFSDPSSEFQKSDLNSLVALYMRLTSLDPNPSNLSYGIKDGQLWFKRTFYKHTFSDTPTEAHTYPLEELYKKTLALLHVVNRYHKAGVFHGHITPHNLVWINTEPVLLDFGFSSFARDRESLDDIAPEVAGGGKAGLAADIYGIGAILKTLFAGREASDEERIIESMLSGEPALRPTLENLIEFFETRLLPFHPQKDPPSLKEADAPLPQENENLAQTLVGPSQKLEVIAEESAPSPKNNSALATFFLVCLVLFTGTLLGYKVFTNFSVANNENKPVIDPKSFDEMWRSNQPSLMKQVALAALRDHDPVAYRIIVSSALNGEKVVKVKGELLKIVFDPRWEGDLNDLDRDTALALAVAALAPDEVGQISSLHDRHPGVLLGILATLPISMPVNQLSGIPVSKMSTLPQPLGTAFSELSKIGITDITDSSVRALTHLVTNQGGEVMITAFFGKDQDELTLFKKLRILIPFALERPDLEMPIYSQLLANSQLFAQMMRWFDEEDLAEWSKVNRTTKFQILAGIWPSQQLSPPQYVDLLLFPNPTIASRAKEVLQNTLYKGKNGALLGFFASPGNKLSRHASMSLLAALSLAGKEEPSFYGKWFDAKPDPKSILSILIIRSDAAKDDVFNVAGAQYLLGLGVNAPQPTFEEAKHLAAHPEALVRAFTYSKLRKTELRELKILKNMAIAEPNEKLRTMIQNLLR